MHIYTHTHKVRPFSVFPKLSPPPFGVFWAPKTVFRPIFTDLLPTASHSPRGLPGQLFAIKHRACTRRSPTFGLSSLPRGSGRCQAKTSGRLGPDATDFLESYRILCRFTVLHFHALTNIISAKRSSAQIILRWLRYLRRPIKGIKV